MDTKTHVAKTHIHIHTDTGTDIGTCTHTQIKTKTRLVKMREEAEIIAQSGRIKSLLSLYQLPTLLGPQIHPSVEGLSLTQQYTLPMHSKESSCF